MRSLLLVALALTFSGCFSEELGTESVIKTKRLEIQDEQGKARIVLSCPQGKAPSVDLLDAKGRLVIVIGVSATETESYLVMRDGETGKSRVTVGVLQGDSPRVHLHGKDGPYRLSLEIRDGEPRVILHDDTGSPKRTIQIEGGK